MWHRFCLMDSRIAFFFSFPNPRKYISQWEMCSLQVMLSSSLIWVCSCFTAAEANEVKTVSSYMLGSTILLPVPLLRHIWLQNKNPPWASIWNRAVLEESLEAHVNVSFVSIDDSPAIRPMQRNKDIEFLSTSFFLFIIYNLKVLFHQACYEINTDIISHKEGVRYEPTLPVQVELDTKYNYQINN